MSRRLHVTTAAALVLLTSACSDFFSPGSASGPSDALTAAFATVPLGFTEATSSYAGDGDQQPSLWLAGHRAPRFAHGTLMGGGLGEAFAGGIGRGRGFGHHGPFGGPFTGALACTGSFDAAAGRFTCDPVSRNGLTITRSASYRSAAGVVQQAFDTLTTDVVNVRTAVEGTTSWVRDSSRGGHRSAGGRHAGRLVGDTTTILSANTTVRHASERTVTGLASGSSARTVNGTSLGDESSTGTSSQGDFTSRRTAADSTRGLVIPIVEGRPTYPSAGTVIRTMAATVTYAGQAATSATRREVVTYDGTDVAKVSITLNGATKECTRPLPRGPLTCS